MEVMTLFTFLLHHCAQTHTLVALSVMCDHFCQVCLQSALHQTVKNISQKLYQVAHFKPNQNTYSFLIEISVNKSNPNKVVTLYVRRSIKWGIKFEKNQICAEQCITVKLFFSCQTIQGRKFSFYLQSCCPPCALLPPQRHLHLNA